MPWGLRTGSLQAFKKALSQRQPGLLSCWGEVRSLRWEKGKDRAPYLFSAWVMQTVEAAVNPIFPAPSVDTGPGENHVCPLLLPPEIITGETGVSAGRWCQARPGLPHFVAVSVAVTKWWPGRDRILGLSPGRGEVRQLLPSLPSA